MEPENCLREAEEIISRIAGNEDKSTWIGMPSDNEQKKVIDRINGFLEKTSDMGEPNNREELYLVEAKSRLGMEMKRHIRNVCPKEYPVGFQISAAGMTEDLVKELFNSVPEAFKKAEVAIGRLYDSDDFPDRFASFHPDQIRIGKEAEKVGVATVKKYHKVLSGLANGDLKNVYVDASRGTDHPAGGRVGSYHHDHGTTMVALDMLNNLYEVPKAGGKGFEVRVDEPALISHYGHELLGHARHSGRTRKSQLPGTLKQRTRTATPSLEAVSQFYEGEIFNLLAERPDVRDELGIERLDEKIANYQDRRAVREYISTLEQAIQLEVAMDQREKDAEARNRNNAFLSENSIALDTTHRMYRNSLRRLDSFGNIEPEALQGTVAYASKNVVPRMVDQFEKKGIKYADNREFIDNTILTGFWTPDNALTLAKLAAEEAAAK